MKCSILEGVKNGKREVILADGPGEVQIKFKELQRKNGGGFDVLNVFVQPSRSQKFKAAKPAKAAPKSKAPKATKDD